MRAWVVGSVPGTMGLTRVERSVASPGPRDVVVDVQAIALNYRDLLVTEGAYHKGVPPAGTTPCSDAAGIVSAVGAEVTGLAVGDRVMTMFAPDWQDGNLSRTALRTTLGSGSGPGVLAERVSLPENAFVRMPSRLSFLEASTLPCAGLTAWHALFEEEPKTSGQSVLVLGAGGVSVFAVQMAHAAGIRVFAITSTGERLERLRSLGVSNGVNYRSQPEWGEAIRELAGGDGVDLVVEVGGAATLGESLRAVRPGGTIALIGTVAGPAPVNLTPVLLRNIRVQGTMVGSRAMCTRMLTQLTEWRHAPVIDAVFGFDEAPRAFDHLASGKHFGKVVIQAAT
jgi:NADPH:quinone reductase-like Zn-dependent oxidoreductase